MNDHSAPPPPPASSMFQDPAVAAEREKFHNAGRPDTRPSGGVVEWDEAKGRERFVSFEELAERQAVAEKARRDQERLAAASNVAQHRDLIADAKLRMPAARAAVDQCWAAVEALGKIEIGPPYGIHDAAPAIHVPDLAFVLGPRRAARQRWMVAVDEVESLEAHVAWWGRHAEINRRAAGGLMGAFAR